MTQFHRYVALGDSQTEGLWDGDDRTNLRGWADRLADHVAAVNPDLHYANLAVRGLLAEQVLQTQLDAALALQPDLVTVMAGMNDLIRPSFDVSRVGAAMDSMVSRLRATGTAVGMVTFPNIGKLVPIAAGFRGRVLALNASLRQTAERHGAVILETSDIAVATDSRIWNADRLHLNPLGHAIVAAGMANALGFKGFADWSRPLPARPAVRWPTLIGAETQWVTGFFGPWVMRRIRGKSSADGCIAKRPELRHVDLSARPCHSSRTPLSPK